MFVFDISQCKLFHQIVSHFCSAASRLYRILLKRKREPFFSIIIGCRYGWWRRCKRISLGDRLRENMVSCTRIHLKTKTKFGWFDFGSRNTYRESIKEDDDGLVESTVAEIIQKAKRKRQMMKRGTRRLGMMRHLNLIIDCSESMSFPDLKPTRMLCTAKVRPPINSYSHRKCEHSLIWMWILISSTASGNFHRRVFWSESNLSNWYDFVER